MGTSLPQIPGYFALRVGADLASAIRGETVFFNYSPGTLEVMSAPPGGTPPGELPGIPLFTPALAAGRPPVQEVTIEVTNQRGQTVSRVLRGDQYGALFWSESAVEKFLLPYYVSAGGPHAYQVLHAINKAWYNYAVRTPVCALAFAYPSRAVPTPIQLWDTLSVVYLTEDGTLDQAPLLSFLASQPPPEANPIARAAAEPLTTPPPVGPVPYPIDSVGAREVAEYVSGLRPRKVDVYSVELGGGLDPVLSPEGDGTPLFTAESPLVRTDRPPVTVSLTYTLPSGGAPIPKPLTEIGGNPANVADSAFWTDAAVELLMLPYYASVEGAAAPWYLALLLGTWSGAIAPGIEDAAVLLSRAVEGLGRVLPAKPANALDRAVERLAAEAEEAVAVVEATETGPFESEVFALVHLPNSEWVDQQAAGVPTIFLEHRTGVLTTRGDFPLTPPGARLFPRRRVTG
jgi:hypothetical protein